MGAVTNSGIQSFQSKMLDWFLVNSRDFPWREENLSPYQLIIAEILLQRTKAETVNTFYKKFISKYSNWSDLNNESIAAIEEFLRPIGLSNQRASRLKSLAKEMVIRNCELPEQRSDLESIPLMGQYIANAVELLIYGKRFPLLDVNMSRVLERYFGTRKLADIRYDPYLQKLAFKVVDHPSAKHINWAILDFAAIVCKARNPHCLNCILSDSCNYFSIKRIESE